MFNKFKTVSKYKCSLQIAVQQKKQLIVTFNIHYADNIIWTQYAIQQLNIL